VGILVLVSTFRNDRTPRRVRRFFHPDARRAVRAQDRRHPMPAFQGVATEPRISQEAQNPARPRASQRLRPFHGLPIGLSPKRSNGEHFHHWQVCGGV
jgi:hypothetical protein